MGRFRAEALPIAAVVLVVLVLAFGALAASLAQDWIRVIAATPTLTPTLFPSDTPTVTSTFTPSPTSTPSSTFTLTPTGSATPTPSATPTFTPTPSSTATHTAVPTYTPYPTYTPFPTNTPVPCNPSRRDPATIRANLANSPQQATGILQDAVRRWTRGESLPQVGSPSVRFYLTYISPQVVEALVLERSLREGIPVERRPDLLVEYDRLLETHNVFPFILTLRGPADRSRQVRLAPLEQNLVLIPQNRQTVPALREYAAVFAAPVTLERGVVSGHVLFPRRTGTGCTPTINLAIDRSFDVRLTGIALSGFLSVPFMTNDQVGWSFDSLPDTSLEQVLRIPLPAQVADLDQTAMTEILAVASSVFEGVLR